MKRKTKYRRYRRHRRPRTRKYGGATQTVIVTTSNPDPSLQLSTAGSLATLQAMRNMN